MQKTPRDWHVLASPKVILNHAWGVRFWEVHTCVVQGGRILWSIHALCRRRSQVAIARTQLKCTPYPMNQSMLPSNATTPSKSFQSNGIGQEFSSLNYMVAGIWAACLNLLKTPCWLCSSHIFAQQLIVKSFLWCVPLSFHATCVPCVPSLATEESKMVSTTQKPLPPG